jgi:TPR repeat protein
MLAEQRYRRACILGHADGCFELGRVQMPRDADGAKRSFESACVRQSKLGCAALVVGYGDKRPVVADVKQKQALQASCTKGDARACGKLGLLDAALNPAIGKPNLDRACRQRDAFACALAERVK